MEGSVENSIPYSGSVSITPYAVDSGIRDLSGRGHVHQGDLQGHQGSGRSDGISHHWDSVLSSMISSHSMTASAAFSNSFPSAEWSAPCDRSNDMIWLVVR